MWKLLFQSVRGTAHERGGQPCQDSCLVRLRSPRDAPVLVLACADGAGSAALADVGARSACEGVVRLVLADLAEGLPLAAIDRDTALSWHLRLRGELDAVAERRGATPADLACTLLLAVVGTDAAVFSQIGDGVIVTLDGDEYRPVFWPQSGEYANTTHFVTGPNLAECLLFAQRPGGVEELALMSDGLQMLALRFAERAAHGPFFRPMFERLRASAPGENLAAALRRFLSSPAVCARSDDDKTLILATRVPARAAATPP
jgi:hypothetical protein